LEIIDIIHIDIIDFVKSGIYVPGNGNIDKEHRPMAPSPDNGLDLVFMDDVVAGACGAYNNIYFFELGRKFVKG